MMFDFIQTLLKYLYQHSPVFLKKTISLMRDFSYINFYKSARSLLSRVNNRSVHYITANHFIGTLKTELKSGDLNLRISFLKKNYPIIKPRSIRFLISLYRYLLNLEKTMVWNNMGEKPFIVHFCCWGEDYAEKAKSYLLPSFLAEGNLPEISKTYTITICIHCDAYTKAIIESADVFQQIKRYAVFNFILLPTAILKKFQTTTKYPDVLFFKKINRINQGLKYLLFGAMQAYALNKGIKQNALVSFLIPDSLISENFFTYSTSCIKDKLFVLSTTFRTDYNKARESIEHFYANVDKTVISMPGSEMVNMQIKYLHETEKRRVISPATYDFLPCPRFIFKTQRGLVLRALHYHPVLMDCSKLKKDFNVDYFPIDDSVIKQILDHQIPYENQVSLCSDPSLMNFMELSGLDPEIHDARPLNICSTYDSLVFSLSSLLKACPNDLDEKIHRFFIRNVLNFATEEIDYPDNEIIDSEKFIKDIYNKIDLGD